MARRVFFVGLGQSHHLPATYQHAFEELGWQTMTWDLDAAVRGHARLGELGARFNDYVPVEAWVRKANRDLLVEALAFRPDLVVVVGHASVRVGMLSQMLVGIPGVRLALVWPDTLLNLGREELECLPVYDLVACYSRDSVAPFERLGARRAEWVPLAADPRLHHPLELDESVRARWESDILFVGSYRVERERSVLAMLDAGLQVKVWGGPQWRKSSRQPERVGSYWQGRELHGREFATASACAKVCINLIDPTNFPAANMRFFENFLFGAATVNTACPEMEDVFQHDVHTVYASSDEDLVVALKRLLRDEPLRWRLGRAGRERVLDAHTYAHRARQMVDALGLEA